MKTKRTCCLYKHLIIILLSFSLVQSGQAYSGADPRIVFDAGSYACINGSYVLTSYYTNNGANMGIHPYVQQNKNLTCRSLVSTFGAPKPSGDTAEVYQPFFEGNPVYYQTWENYEYKWNGGVTIQEHGIKGDTIVNGIAYHKLRVGHTAINQSVPEFWVRESERHDKVWVRMPWDTEGRETLVVDMDLQPGDLFTISTYPDTVYYEVDSVYYMEHDGGTLKHIRLKPQTDNRWTYILENIYILSQNNYPERRPECSNWLSRHLEFIEGVGSNLGFVYPRLGLSETDPDTLWEPLRSGYGIRPYYTELRLYDYMVCMDRGSMPYYVHPNSACATCADEYLWLEELCYDEGPDIPGLANEAVRSMSRYLRLSPNPARESVSLHWAADSPVGGACRITLYSLQGVVLRTLTTDSWPCTLNVADLPAGPYVLRVVPEEASATWQATVRLTKL